MRIPLWSRKQRNEELSEEILAHLTLAEREEMESGRTKKEAESAARRHFGNAPLVGEVTRDAWGWEWLHNLGQDVRFALRMMRRSPGFTAVAILTIALGIGATTAIFSVVDATLLHPLPYPQPEQLVTIQDDLPGVGAKDVGMSVPEWQDLQRSGIFDYISPDQYDENNLTGSSQPASVKLLIVAPNYFSLLGVSPQLGSAWNPQDHSPGLLPDALISDDLWKGLFGGDPHILNKSFGMDTDLYRIVGVMPPGFRSPGRTTAERNIEVWAATSFYGAPMVDHPPRSGRYLPTAIARLKPGLTIAQAQTRLDALVASLLNQYPADYPAQNAWAVRMVPLKETVVGNVRQSLVLLLGAVGLVLLIGCVNVANLLLARASARGREMALRQALGAARPRLVRQLLTESLFLSLLGGIAGLAILFSVKGFLLHVLPANLPRLNEISISWGVLFFALAAAAVSGVIFGLAPALHAGRLDLTTTLKMEGRGSTGSVRQTRTRRALVVTEFALSLVLMIAASLLLRSFWDLLNAQLGFNPQNVMSVRTRLPYPNVPAADKYAVPAQVTPFIRELLRHGATLPGVEEVALGDSGSIPLERTQKELTVIAEGQFFFTLEGRDIQSDQPAAVERSSVTENYFHLLGIPLLRGRFFNESDNDKATEVAVINEAFARDYWPNENPLGKRFRPKRAGSPWITIVGIVANARTDSLAEANVPQIYTDLYQTGTRVPHRLAMFLRGHLDPVAIPDEVRRQVQTVDPTLPVYAAQMLDETASESLTERRFSMEMVGLFALTALLLAGIGIYGVISYMVSERTHEFGIRIALGAQPGNILRMVVRQGLSLAIVGAAVGLVGAVIVSQLMAGLLYGVRPTDPLTFAGVSLLLLGVALLASYIPARRAVRVDPLVALRHE